MATYSATSDNKVGIMPAPGGEPTKVKCNYIRANVITFAQM